MDNNNCNNDCNNCDKDCKNEQLQKATLNKNSKVKKVIAVFSGKGGVGKSSVTMILANELTSQGFKVGIMDADITGPSIAHGYNIRDKATGSNEGILPAVTENNIQVISMNMLLSSETDPTVWRGPILGGVIKQFYTDVIWNDLDYLLIDMPPGTSDAALTVFEMFDIQGVILVSMPQSLINVIVQKAINMTKLMNIKILGIVENMSYFKCPECGKTHTVFGESKIDEIAVNLGIDTVIKLPIDTDIVDKIDKGLACQIQTNYFDKLIDKIKI